MPNNDPDAQIIQKILSGEPQSFKLIVEKYQQRVLSLCRSMVGEPDYEDAAQEIFLRVFASLVSFKGRSAFSTWLYRVASNHCLNLISKKKRERTESLESRKEQLGEELPSPPAGNSLEAKQAVQFVLKRMNEEERLILTLREIQGLSYNEISLALEISLDLVKVRLFRSRQSFIKLAGNLL